MTKWQEVKITLNREALEGAYAVLDQQGITNYAVEDSALMDQAQKLGWGDYFPEQAVMDLVTIICYFSEHLSEEQINQLRTKLLALEEFGFDPGPVTITAGQVSEEDWAKSWKAYYKPLTIGQVHIRPSWEKLEEGENSPALVVYLDPGMAFGSGTHPTTAMCIDFLQNLNLQNRVLWDVGTGSGILAIVAAKLGAQVQAVDIDPMAVRVAKENRDFNQVDFTVKQGTLEDFTGKAEIIVANIIADVIGPMFSDVYQALEPEGFFIASGVIEDRDREIISLGREAGLRLLRRKQEGEWISYLWQRSE